MTFLTTHPVVAIVSLILVIAFFITEERIVFHVIALWSCASYWLRFKRVCAWHSPKPRRMGGNPFARRITHGICPECFARQSAEIISHPKF